MRAFVAILGLMLAAPPAWAAESWGLPNEQPAMIDGKVVDALCVLVGDCPKGCGAGKRQLAILTPEGKLVLAMKNADPFGGAVRDLLPHCGQSVAADGLFATNEGVTVFALQRVKPKGGAWIAANGFARDWAKARGLAVDDPKIEEWYRHDPTVATIIAKDGKLGLGPP
ncbi:MAG: hypothetical protein IT565_02915 [Rhodospirillales bacterium]|nr:hypothetical protein [Rhodospirillales bacterium]